MKKLEQNETGFCSRTVTGFHIRFIKIIRLADDTLCELIESVLFCVVTFSS